MGYETYFEISIEGKRDMNVTDQQFDEELEAITGYSNLFSEPAWCKWYDWEKDMKEFSKLHPDLIFRIDATGEEHTDLWRAFFKNGKCVQHAAKITYPKFQESNLR